MAGDWIKLRSNLWDDPRVSSLCDATGASEAAVIGGLYWLWATADQHTEDGFMPGLTAASIDRKTGVRGLGAGLVAIGWLVDDPRGVVIRREDNESEPLFIVGFNRLRPCASVWNELRAAAFNRDGWQCVYCGQAATSLECDHIHPVSKGGSNDLSNLATACIKCNRSKGAKTVSEWRCK